MYITLLIDSRSDEKKQEEGVILWFVSRRRGCKKKDFCVNWNVKRIVQ
jgi:hypothetical protein